MPLFWKKYECSCFLYIDLAQLCGWTNCCQATRSSRANKSSVDALIIKCLHAQYHWISVYHISIYSAVNAVWYIYVIMWVYYLAFVCPPGQLLYQFDLSCKPPVKKAEVYCMGRCFARRQKVFALKLSLSSNCDMNL